MGAQNRALECHWPSIDGAEAIYCEGVVRALKRWEILGEGLGKQGKNQQRSDLLEQVRVAQGDVRVQFPAPFPVMASGKGLTLALVLNFLVPAGAPL